MHLLRQQREKPSLDRGPRQQAIGAISRATRASTRAAATGALTMTNAPAEAGEGGRSVEGTATKRPRPGLGRR